MQNWFSNLSPGMRHLVNVVVGLILSIAVSYAAMKLGVPAPAAPVVELVQTPLSPTAKDYNGETPPPVPSHAFGWVNDPEARAASFARVPVVQFASTPAGKVALAADSPDVFLWEAVRRAANKPAPWYSNINQLSVGCCVGCGWKHAADVCLAVQVLRRGGEWRPLSAEVIYGASRVDIGKGQINGDGSLGAWANEAVNREGVAVMEKYASDDLTKFDPIRARKYGRSGVPKDIKEAASEHPIKATALVKSWAEVQKAISQGYPVAVCSDQGFENPNGSPGTRDAQGFCKARGTWPHCMAIIGARGGDRPGAFILNSWGDTAHTGPTFPADAPKAGFWADSFIIDRMVKQGDSYALADVAGFEARPLDWFTKAEPAPARDPFAVGFSISLGRKMGQIYNTPVDPFALRIDADKFRAVNRHALAW